MDKEELIKLFSEPSTYAGFSAIALAFGVSSEEYVAISSALAGIFGAVAVLMREKGKD